jgi:hypothetical protein
MKQNHFQYAVTATLLTTSLERRTKFFSCKGQIDSMVSNLSLSRNSSEAEQVSLAFLYRPVQFNSIRGNEILFFCVKQPS